LTSTHLQGRLARWSLRLQELLPGLTIEHRKGTMHRSVDALTRDPTFDSGDEGETSTPLFNQEINYCGYQPLDEIYVVDGAAHCSSTPAAADLVTADPSAAVATMDTEATTEDPNPAPATNGARRTLTYPSAGSPATPTCHEGPVEGEVQSILTPVPASYLPWRPGITCRAQNASPVRIYIDGNIGSGKSRVVAHLAQELSCAEWHLVPEPVQDWEQLLDPFYSAATGSDTRQCIAALLQIAVLVAYAKATPDTLSAPLVVMERGPWSSLEVFLAAQHLPKALEQLVCGVAFYMNHSLSNTWPSAIVYLDVPPEECLRRIQQRQRPGEEGVTLEYLQSLEQQYKQALSGFPGPKIVIHADAAPEKVAAAALDAVRLLAGQTAVPLSPSLPAATDSQLQSNPAQQDSPDNMALATTPSSDPQLSPMQQLLVFNCGSEGAAAASHPSTAPTSANAANAAVPSYLYTPLALIYNAELELPVLFQNGPGRFAYSEAFHALYQERYGEPVNALHRINNVRAVEVYSQLGPHAANAPGSNIQLAVAPRKALGALLVHQVHENGTEAVYVDTNTYARHRMRGLTAQFPGISRQGSFEAAFPWQDGLRNEGFVLDGWIRLVRLRPLLRCGLQASLPLVNTATVTPLLQEMTYENCESNPATHLRLASSVPHQAEVGAQLGTAQLNVLDQTTATAAAVRRSMPSSQHRKVPAVKTAVAETTVASPSEAQQDSGPSVDPDLACKQQHQQRAPSEGLRSHTAPAHQTINPPQTLRSLAQSGIRMTRQPVSSRQLPALLQQYLLQQAQDKGMQKKRAGIHQTREMMKMMAAAPRTSLMTSWCCTTFSMARLTQTTCQAIPKQS
jgi:deoxyadenosine/deoxycytidine kinase